MLNLIKRLALAAAILFAVTLPAAAQWQVANHAIPLGKGAGLGFSAVAPAATTKFLVGGGTSSDPVMQTMSGDCSLLAGAVTCTKTNGSSFATVATSGSASDLGTGTLPNARLDAKVQCLTGLTTAADKVAYYTGSGTCALADFGSAMRTLLTTSSSANLRAFLSDESGTGLAYFQGGDLGTPSAGVATNLTGTASGLTAGNVTTNANLTGPITSVGNATTVADAELACLAGLTSAADKLPYFSGSGTCALADLSSAFRTFLTTPSSANLRAVLSDEVGTGAFYTVGGALGTPASGTLTNATGLPVAGITSSTSTALGVGSLELGNASDTTLSRASAGDVNIEGNLAYRAGGTDVPLTDGGTGASTAAGARTNLGLGTSAVVDTGTSGTKVPLLDGANTWSANQTIAKATPLVVLNKSASGQKATLVGQQSGNARWNFNIGDDGAEAGSNAGSNFTLDRFNDAGSYIDTPLVMSRASGLMSLFNGLSLNVPVTKTANFTVADNENFLINNKSGSSCTVTLPAASSYFGRMLFIKNLQAQTVISASSNVVPQAGGAAGTAILASGTSHWALLVSDGTNWIIMLSA